MANAADAFRGASRWEDRVVVWCIIYRCAPRAARGRKEALEESLPVPVLFSPSAQQLVDAGVSRKTALELLEAHPSECEQQLEYLPFCDARDPGAVLVKSIPEGWSAPPAWTQAQEEKKKAARAQQRRVQTEEKVQTNAAFESEFDAFWASLTVQQREEVEAAAAATLRKENWLLAEYANKHPDSPMYRGVLRPYLKQLNGWKPSKVSR